MRPIQVILIATFVASVVLYFRRLRSNFVDRVVLLSLAAVGAVLTVAPDLSTSLAQAVGVGRGVDLVIYLALVCLFFLCLVLQAQVRQLQESLTELARALALSNANEAAAEQGSPGEPAGGTSA